MEVFPASVVLIVHALLVSARWAGRQRRVTLERMTAAAEASRVAELEARVVTLEDRLELREAHIAVLESRLGKERSRKPYPLVERLRIIWLMEYFQIPQRRLAPRRAPASASAKVADTNPRQIVARYPNHVWSVDRTRVWRWRIWPTWVLVAIDHCSRMVTTTCPLECAIGA